MNSPHYSMAAISGGSGYLGARLAAHLVGRGWQVRVLGRRPVASVEADFKPFELGQEPPVEILAGADTLIHCAWDFSRRTWPEIERVNVEGTRRLLDVAASAGVRRLLHVSTVSASGAPRSMYGRAKRETEKLAHERGAAVVRPGLLYGAEPGGMVGMLNTLMRALPVVPVLVGADRPLFLAHDDDVCELLRAVAEGRESAEEKPLVAAARDPHSLREVLEALARAAGRKRAYVRVPWHAVYLVLRGLEMARVPMPMRADSALSIGTLDPDPFASAEAPQVTDFRHFDPRALKSGGHQAA